MKNKSKFRISTLGLMMVLMALVPTIASANDPSFLSAEENGFVSLLNQLRTKLNLKPLTLHPSLLNAARKHSFWMAEQDRTLRNGDQLTHYGPGKNDTLVTRAKENEGYLYRRLGENIACGFPDAKRIFRLWAHSPVHLANMIHPQFREIGIARAGDGSEECPYYWTNDFGVRMQEKPTNQNKPSDQQVREAIEELINQEDPESEAP